MPPSPRSPRRVPPVRRLPLLPALLLAAALGACVTQGPATGPYAEAAPYEGMEVVEVRFEPLDTGGLRLPADTLEDAVVTRASSCGFLGIEVCPFGFLRTTRTLDVSELARDVVRVGLLYRDVGIYGTRVVPDVEPVAEGADEVRVTFSVAPGTPVVLDSLAVGGTEGIVPPEELVRRLPLKVGERFERDLFLASADTVRRVLLDRGHAYAEVLRNYGIDTRTGLAEAQFEAIPGPQVTVDTVLVLGLNRLEEETVRRQLSFDEGDLLRATELSRSQRGLYDLPMIGFASVEIAPDSLQVDTALAAATVAVRIVEAAQYRVDAAGGYGTIDCLRGDVRRIDRNFLGGGRTLELSAAASKIGVGDPADFGLDGSLLCQELEDDPFSEDVNYRLAADFLQPRFLGTQTSVTARLEAERVSEFQVYQREATGAQLSMSREVLPQTLFGLTANVSRGRTEAEPVFFCIGQEVCSTEAIENRQRDRWSNWLSLSLVRDRGRQEVIRTRGWQARANADWATEWFGSDDDYLRLSGDVAAYRTLRPGWVLSGRLYGGTFLQSGSFIPPERRFYAGGPSTVRGFPRNAVGPQVYVVDKLTLEDGDTVFRFEDGDPRGTAVGGTTATVASLELGVPSPVLRDYLRLAAFVDAGQVWRDRGDVDLSELRVTPGVGIRIITPVGPIRVDAAYNPYGLEEGNVLLVSPKSGEITDLRRDFDPPLESGLLGRVQIYVAVGSAF